MEEERPTEDLAGLTAIAVGVRTG